MSQTPQQPEQKDERKKSAPSVLQSAVNFFGAIGSTIAIFSWLFKGIGWLFRGIFWLLGNIFRIIFAPIKFIFNLLFD